MYPEPIQKLASFFSRLPGIGPRMGARLAFHLLKASDQEVQEFGEAILQLHKRMRLCAFCFNPFSPSTSSGQTLCSICSDSARTKDVLCIVEKESDLEALEATGAYRGLYFILGGTVGMFRKVDMKHLRMDELKERIADPKKFGLARRSTAEGLAPEGFSEAILAMNLTTEGEATALYLERVFGPLNIKTTRLGRGLPVGGELEYSDSETLRQSLENRR